MEIILKIRERLILYSRISMKNYMTDHNCGNIEAKTFLNKLESPQIDDEENE